MHRSYARAVLSQDLQGIARTNTAGVKSNFISPVGLQQLRSRFLDFRIRHQKPDCICVQMRPARSSNFRAYFPVRTPGDSERTRVLPANDFGDRIPCIRKLPGHRRARPSSPYDRDGCSLHAGSIAGRCCKSERGVSRDLGLRKGFGGAGLPALRCRSRKRTGFSRRGEWSYVPRGLKPEFTTPLPSQAWKALLHPKTTHSNQNPSTSTDNANQHSSKASAQVARNSASSLILVL